MQRLLWLALCVLGWTPAPVFACTVGNATVPCEGTLRTVIVAKSGGGHYTTIQSALDQARAGDEIQVRTGTYTEKLITSAVRPGTVTYPVKLRNYPGEAPALRVPAGAVDGIVNVNSRWFILEGLDIGFGWHGVQVNASNVIVRNNTIHDHSNQGVLHVSNTDTATYGNVIERNGLTSPTPWLMHGIYFSNFYQKPMTRHTVLQNIIRQHGGSAVQSYGPLPRISQVVIAGNTLSENAVDLIAVATDTLLYYLNTIHHAGYPPTNAPRTAVFWLENSTAITVQQNTATWGILAPTIPALLIYESHQDIAQTTFTGNTWPMPAGWPVVTDADLGAL